MVNIFDLLKTHFFTTIFLKEFLEKKTPSKRKLGMYAEEPQGELCN